MGKSHTQTKTISFNWLVFVVVVFKEKVSYVVQASPELTMQAKVASTSGNPPDSVSQVLGLL